MNSLMKHFDGHELTIINDKGETKFLLRDVCNILGLGQVAGVIRRLEDDVIWNHPIIDSIGRNQQATFVNEDGLYDVILDSRKPDAKRFRKWITSEVLPTIRKTGGYQSQEPLNEKQQLMAAMKLTSITAEETEALKQVTTKHGDKINELEHKIENEITLQHGEQRRLQKAVGSRVYKLANNDVDEKRRLFSEIHREIKDRFGVASYKDVKRQELQSAIWYINHWIPKKVLV